MFEYIKRVSIAVSFISRKIDTEGHNVKKVLEDLSLSLLALSQHFRDENYSNDDLQKLADKISYLIDVVDFARINSFVSPMNARVFVESQVNFLKHVLNLLEQKNSLTMPLYQLNQLDDVMTRKNAKENLTNKNFDFSFTSIPTVTTKIIFEENKEDKKTDTDFEIEKEVEVIERKMKEIEPEIKAKKIVEESMLYPQVSTEASPEHVEKEISERRSRILKVLTTGGGSIREISAKLRDINEKTLQRDLLELMRDKKIIMLGKKRWAKYYLK